MYDVGLKWYAQRWRVRRQSSQLYFPRQHSMYSKAVKSSTVPCFLDQWSWAKYMPIYEEVLYSPVPLHQRKHIRERIIKMECLWAPFPWIDFGWFWASSTSGCNECIDFVFCSLQPGRWLGKPCDEPDATINHHQVHPTNMAWPYIVMKLFQGTLCFTDSIWACCP